MKKKGRPFSIAADGIHLDGDAQGHGSSAKLQSLR
jgi:hypothetical protein